MNEFMRSVLMVLVLTVVVGWGVLAQAARIYPLPEEQKANLGATHMVKYTYEDFTETVVDTAETFSEFTVEAKQGIEVVAVMLKTAFDAPVGSNALVVTVGDGTDADLFVSSMAISTNGTVWLKYGRGMWTTATSQTFLTNVAETASTVVVTNIGEVFAQYMTNMTMLTTTLTNMTNHNAESSIVVHTNLAALFDTAVATVTVTRAASVLTDVVTSGTAGMVTDTLSFGRKLYTADDTIDVVFTPSNGESLSDFTQGEIYIYIERVNAIRPR